MALYAGLALGDLGGDQDLDVVASDKWYERPADPTVQDWSGRTVFADPVQNVYCHDVNGDNRLDVVAAEGFKHPDGRIMWAEAPAAPKTELWTVHVVARTWTALKTYGRAIWIDIRFLARSHRPRKTARMHSKCRSVLPL